MEKDITYKYICIKCNFKCNEPSKWKKHIITEKHIKKKQRSDYNGPYKCPTCNYETKNNTTYKQHILNEHSDKEKREAEFKYYCKLCDIGTFSKQLISRHNMSERHKKREKNYTP